MADQNRLGVLMKNFLLLAAAIILIRLITEQLGAPDWVNMIFGVAWLYFIVPVFFAREIIAGGDEKPMKTLAVSLFFFALYTRLMVAVTYMLAYAFSWQAPRFLYENGGTVGSEVSPLDGYLLIPARNILVWVVAAMLVGMLIGWVTTLFSGKKEPASS